jgi:eukaryotic-like serine/threonine-protein kinase
VRLSDGAVERLRETVREPELAGTRYRLVRRVGTGGMGAVYEADDVTLERRVALKVLEMPDPGGTLARHLSREARVLASLEHPGIVPVHDAGTLPDGRVYYAMKLVEGLRLDEHLRRVPSLAGKLRLFLRALEAVAFAHAKGVLHRDLKPSNVMVGPFGEVLVMDWGLATRLSETGDAISAVVGTRGFMSPEQASGRGVDVRSDVYGLGVSLRAILAADGTFRTPAALDAIVAKATAAQPSDRYADVPSMAADILRYLDGERVDAHAEGLAGRAARLLKRNRVAVLLVLAYLAARTLMILWPR